MSGVGAVRADATDEGDGRRKVLSASLLRGLAVLSALRAGLDSERKGIDGAGAGEEGRLAGRKKGVLSTFIFDFVVGLSTSFLSEYAKRVWVFYCLWDPMAAPAT